MRSDKAQFYRENNSFNRNGTFEITLGQIFCSLALYCWRWGYLLQLTRQFTVMR